MKLLFILVLFFVSQVAFSAMPAHRQHAKDLDTMVNFSKKNKKIMASLKSIDLTTHTIYFGNNCKALFIRKIVQRKKNWSGPPEPLEFKYSTCSL